MDRGAWQAPHGVTKSWTRAQAHKYSLYHRVIFSFIFFFFFTKHLSLCLCTSVIEICYPYLFYFSFLQFSHLELKSLCQIKQ